MPLSTSKYLHKLIVRYHRTLSLKLDQTAQISGKTIPNTIAVIRLDAIGDFILWLEAAKQLRLTYPNQPLTLIANSIWADLARQLPYWDNVLPINVRRLVRQPFYRWRVLRQIRATGFDIAIQPTFSRVLLQGDSLIRATGARQRIGSVGDLSNISLQDKTIGDSWYTRLIPASPVAMTELERNAEFVGGLSGREIEATLPAIPTLNTTHQHMPDSAFFIVVPGASWTGRQWPVMHFAQTIKLIATKYGLLPVLCGSAAERDLCQQLADSLSKSCKNLAGQTSLAELVELVRKATLVISNETSAIHIAAAVGTPSVCILGGGHYGRFMPYRGHREGLLPLAATHRMPCYNCNWQCTQPHTQGEAMPCIAEIKIETVVQLAETALRYSAK